MQYAYMQRMRQSRLRNYAALLAQGAGNAPKRPDPAPPTPPPAPVLPYQLTLGCNWSFRHAPEWHYYVNGEEVGDYGIWNDPMRALLPGDRLKIVVTNPAGLKITKLVLDRRGAEAWDHAADFSFDDDRCRGETLVRDSDAGKTLRVIAWFEEIPAA